MVCLEVCFPKLKKVRASSSSFVRVCDFHNTETKRKEKKQNKTCPSHRKVQCWTILLVRDPVHTQGRTTTLYGLLAVALLLLLNCYCSLGLLLCCFCCCSKKKRQRLFTDATSVDSIPVDWPKVP